MPKKVIGMAATRCGRGLLARDREAEATTITLGISTHELDLLLELLDSEKPEVIVNFAAQGEGAVSWKHS